MKAELIDHLCFTHPAYSTTRPGILCNATNVPAVNCQEVWPASSHGGATGLVVAAAAAEVVPVGAAAAVVDMMAMEEGN